MEHDISKLNLLNASNTILCPFNLPRLPVYNSHDPRKRNPRIIKIGDMPSKSTDIEIGDIHTEENRDHIANIVNLACAGVVNTVCY